MSNKLFIGGLSWGTTDEVLRRSFEVFGQITEARVVLDPDTGRSRGFAFVTFAAAESALAAKEEMDGASLDDRPLRVTLADVKPARDEP